MARGLDINRLQVTTWLNEEEFIGLWHGSFGPKACYGWIKDGAKSFSIYTVGAGHISRIGSLKETEVDMVWGPRPT